MSRITTSTPPKTIGIMEVYNNYAKELLLANPTYTSERAFESAVGRIFDENEKEYITYKSYKNILALYYIKAGIKLIHGYALNLYSQLGNLFIMRQGRDPSAPLRLNRGESFKLKKQLEKEGKEVTKDNWRVYYTDEEFTRTNWHKPSFVPNIRFYGFKPAGGQPGKGFRALMSREISSNPRLLALYPYLPYKVKPKLSAY